MKTILIVLCIIVISCKSNDFDKKTQKLHLKKIDTQDNLYNPTQILLVKSSLIIGDNRSDGFFFSLIDTCNFNKVYRFCRQGQGPNEVIMPGALMVINKDTVCLRDYGKNKHFFYSLNNIKQNKIDPIYSIEFKSSENIQLTNYISYDSKEELYLGSGIFTNKRYSTFTKEGNHKNKFVDYPKLDLETDDIMAPVWAYQSVICKNPTNNKLASFSRGIIDILEFRNTEIKLIKRVKLYEHPMKYFGGGTDEKTGIKFSQVVTDKEKALIAGDIAHFQCTGNYIYFPFSNEKLNNLKSHMTIEFEEFHLYNWDLELITRFTLDTKIIGIAIDSGENRVFCIALDSNFEPQLMTALI